MTVCRPPEDGRPALEVECEAHEGRCRIGPAPAGADATKLEWHWWSAAVVRRPPTDGRPGTEFECHWFDLRIRLS